MAETTLRDAFQELDNDTLTPGSKRDAEVFPHVQSAYSLMLEGKNFVDIHDFLASKGFNGAEILSAYAYLIVTGVDNDVDLEAEKRGLKLRDAFRQMDEVAERVSAHSARGEQLRNLGMQVFNEVVLEDLNGGVDHVRIYDRLKQENLSDGEVLTVFALITIMGVKHISGQ